MSERVPKSVREIVERENRTRDEFLRMAGLTPEVESIQDQVRRLTAEADAWKEKPYQLPREKVLQFEPSPMIELMRQQNERLNEERQLEQKKLEYAKRSAIASEAALAAALERAEKAERQAEQAEQEKAAERLEKLAEREEKLAERRDKLAAQRATRLSLWFAGASLVVAAWPFLERFF